MGSNNKNISVKTVLTHSKNKPDNTPAGHSVEVHGFSFPSEKLLLVI
jgi:hypothetical protein